MFSKETFLVSGPWYGRRCCQDGSRQAGFIRGFPLEGSTGRRDNLTLNAHKTQIRFYRSGLCIAPLCDRHKLPPVIDFAILIEANMMLPGIGPSSWRGSGIKALILMALSSRG